MAATSLSIVASGTANRGGVPVWTGTPEVRGLNEVDRKLSCRIPAGSYTYTPTLDYARPVPSWQWKRNGAAITGATGPFYLTTSADLGKAITCTVTLTGENGTASATSGSTINYGRTDPGDSNITVDMPVSNVIVANTATSLNLKTTAGWKTSKTTGSMTAGSPTLPVADASGFSIGDQVIVEIGGEAGGGLPGTVGVGGNNITLSYANATAMNADTSQATGKICWLVSTGRVYKWTGSAWTATFSPTYDLSYWTTALPKSLVTTIIGKSGNTLTLNANAVVSTTNANVYFDNYPLADAYFNIYAGATENERKYLPAGEYAFSSSINPGYMNNWYLEGDGETQSILFSPKGVASFSIACSVCHQLVIRNIGIRGNHELATWYVEFGDQNNFGSGGYVRGVRLSRCLDGLITNCRSEKTYNDAFITQAHSDDCVFKSLTCRHVAPFRIYFQWSLNMADSANGSMIDCSVDSNYIAPAIECFRADSINIIRFTGRNAVISTNTSGAFFIDSPTMTIEANSIYNYDPNMNRLTQNWYPQGVLINVNTNIGNTSGSGLDLASNGGTVLNPTVTTEGYMDATYKIRNTCIVVAPAYQAVMVRGGTITVPVYTGGDSFAKGVACDGDGVTVSRTRFIGFSYYNVFPNISDLAVTANNAATLGHGRVFACVGENIQARVSRRNRTNVQFLADGGV